MTPSQSRFELQIQWLVDADEWLRILAPQVRWQTEAITLFGRHQLVPRQVAWYGDSGLCYRYSGTDHRATGWPTDLAHLRDTIAQMTGVQHNFVLLNRYRDGNDSMGWHADDEPALLGDVCSLSLGAERRFLYQLPSGERRKVQLGHGSVATIPRSWRHCLPKTRKPTAERVNLSFRCLQ